MRYQSRFQLFGLPLLSVAFGPDLTSHQALGIARGIIAVGNIGGEDSPLAVLPSESSRSVAYP